MISFMDTVPDMHPKKNLYISKVHNNSGKQTIAYTANIPWDNVPTNLKDLNTFNFSKHLHCLNNILRIEIFTMCSFNFLPFYANISIS